ncbi:sulfate ABC transporter, permease protein [Escherichia coli]|uniref:Sulfate ABC transporter, permease protein n=1 Tax=Escherichia coli TaxID=562 RepID=A0A376NT29_ECOLX|nr:sulfate ABC transporter, permease protein [Escherichia coli]
MLVSAFILLVPMIYIFVQAFSKGLMPVLQNLADPDMLHAIWLTVMIRADCRTGKPGVRHSAGLAGDAL